MGREPQDQEKENNEKLRYSANSPKEKRHYKIYFWVNSHSTGKFPNLLIKIRPMDNQKRPYWDFYKEYGGR